MDIVETEEGLRTLLENSWVEVVDSRHRLKILASLKQFRVPAVEWTSEQIRGSYIYRNDDSLLSTHKIITLSGHKNSLSALFWRHARLLYIVQSVPNYVRTFELEYS